MTHETRMKRLRAIGASALRDGDTATALAIIGILEGRTSGQVPFSAAPSDAKSPAERAAAYRARKRDASRETVTASRDGDRDASRDALRDEEGGKGGGVPGISRDSSENETEIQIRKISTEPPFSLSKSGRARAKSSPKPPAAEVVGLVLQAGGTRPHPDTFFDGTVEAFVRAMSPTGKHSGLSWRDQAALEAAIAAHAPEGCVRAAWVTEAVTSYVAIADDKFRRRTLAHWVRWLDEGQPAPKADTTPQRPGTRVQGGPLAAPLGTNNNHFVPDDDTPADVEGPWRKAMRQAFGATQSPLKNWEAQDLAGLISAHGEGRSGPELAAWFVEIATAYVKAGRAQSGNTRPRHVSDWLDAGRPSSSAPGLRRVVQGAPPLDDEDIPAFPEASNG